LAKNLPPKKILIWTWLIWINLRAVLSAFFWGLGFSVSPKCEKKKKIENSTQIFPIFPEKIHSKICCIENITSVVASLANIPKEIYH